LYDITGKLSDFGFIEVWGVIPEVTTEKTTLVILAYTLKFRNFQNAKSSADFIN